MLPYFPPLLFRVSPLMHAAAFASHSLPYADSCLRRGHVYTVAVTCLLPLIGRQFHCCHNITLPLSLLIFAAATPCRYAVSLPPFLRWLFSI